MLEIFQPQIFNKKTNTFEPIQTIRFNDGYADLVRVGDDLISLKKGIVDNDLVLVRDTGLKDINGIQVCEFHSVNIKTMQMDSDGEYTGSMEDTLFTVKFDKKFSRFVLSVDGEDFPLDTFNDVWGVDFLSWEIMDYDIEALACYGKGVEA